MPTYILSLVAACSLILPALLIRLLLRRLHPAWWRLRPLRIAAMLLCCAAPLSALTLMVPYRPSLTSLVGTGYTGMLLIFIWEALLLALLPLTALFRFLLTRRRAREAAPVVDRERRRFLQLGLAAIPAGALTLSGAGIVEAALPARVSLLRHVQPGLPAELEGLRILHLSDLHLAIFVTLHDLAAILDEAAALKPDLILVTGDIADDLRQLPSALDMIRDLRAPLGAWASLGNHEHASNMVGVLQAFSDHEVGLLVNEAVTLRQGGRDFTLGGIDDPAVGRGGLDFRAFNRRMLEETFPGAREDNSLDRPREFRLLMSHRPRVFDVAPDHGVDLVLAGHTHGGHVALLGSSQYELRGRHPYPWGFYERGDGRLYTTSGAGQWIPFRFGCRAEAPVIELRRT